MTPSVRFIFYVTLATGPLLLAPLAGLSLALAAAPTLVVIAAALIDRITGTKSPFELERRVKPVLSVGTENPVEIRIRNLTGRAIRVELADEPPVNATAMPDRAIMGAIVGGFKTQALAYQLTPDRRGRHHFTGVQVRHASRFGMWQVHRKFPVTSEVQVFPNIEALHRFELLARVNSLAEFGVRSVRMKGDGTEFERLREYRQGDEPKRVDWKATSRFQKLIVREMGQDRNQNILFMIDAGRMMRQTTGGLSHFDYALNTAIILGHIAQQKGDNIGAVFFSNRVQRYVPLGRGRAAVDAIVRAGYDMEPESMATNYSRAFRHVMTHVRKRSMLLMMTHLVPGEDRRLIRSFMHMLGRQHLPLCLFFREQSLEEKMLDVPINQTEAFHQAGAADILLERHEGLESLRHAGVMAVDSLPGELSSVAIGHYLDIKARGLL